MTSVADSTAILQSVSEALRSGDARQAAAIAEAALASGLRHPVLFSARGVWLGEQDRHAEALADFECADAFTPANGAVKSAIGMSLLGLRRYEEAVDAFNAAIALQPRDFQLHVRKGWAFELAGNLPAARRTLEEASGIDPTNPEPFGRLAFLAARVGNWREAQTQASRAIALNADQGTAHLALALCEIETGDLGAAEQRLQRVMQSHVSGPTRRYLAFALMGDIRDRQGRVDEAFALYAKAKDIMRQSQPAPPGQMSMLDASKALCRYFESRAPNAKPRGLPPDGRPHIFLLGFLRTGTTLLEQVLASRDDMTAVSEKDTLADAAQAFMARPQDLEKLWAADEETLATYREKYWNRLRGFGTDPGEKTVVDKAPINTVKIPLIAHLFPKATILFAVRDPRDVVLSCFRRPFQSNVSTREFVTLESAAAFYDAVMRLADIYRAKLPLNLFELRLEDLVADFDGRMRAFCDFAGVPWSDAMRNFAQSAKARAIATPSATQVIRGLNSGGVGQWRRYRAQMEPVLPILKPWVERFGYPGD
jgi:tetratricopeptide (TPR) repeat protein